VADFKYAIRVLVRRPAFTLVAVLTLAIGIGANTAIFSVVNGVLLRPLPYPQPDRIVRLWEQSQGGSRIDVSHPNFLDWRAASASFAALAEYSGGSETVLGGRDAVFADVYAVSEGFFRVFNVAPLLGRTFVAEETRLGGAPAAVVSYRFWQTTLGAERDLTQLRVVIEGVPLRIVGVMPDGFAYPAKADLWAPSELTADTSARTAHNSEVIGRLKPGVALARASAEMNGIAARLKAQYGGEEQAVAVAMVTLMDATTAQSKQTLWLLLGSVGLVLLIACANVATAMLATGEERRAELALRAALGAHRARIVRQLLAESLVIGVAGAIGGLLLAGWLVRALLAVDAVDLSRTADIGIDATVLAFAIVLGVVTPLLFGVFPSLQASRAELRDTLVEGGRSGAAPVRSRVRGMLVASEVAVALVLLVGASLLIRSFANVMSVDPGFDSGGAITATMSVPATKYPDAPRSAQFYSDVLKRIRRLPGAAAAGAVTQAPLSGRDHNGGLVIEGVPLPADPRNRPSAGYRVATPGYLEAAGMRLVRGRTLQDGDRAGAIPVAVVNEAFVRQYLSGIDPLGVRFKFTGMDRVNPTFTIVGIVGNVHHRSLVRAVEPEVFISAYQQPFRARYTMFVLVRPATIAMQGNLAAAVRDTVRDADPDVPVQLSTLDALVSASVADRRFLILVLGSFASIALLLAATGIYSVLSQSVAQRRPEIGIRMALGADARSVVGLMMGTAMRSVVTGVAAGLVAGAAAVRLLTAFLFGVQPLDPLAFAGAVAVLMAVAALAAYLPARRATRVDPLEALRAH
jgi:putative ABC transport system permease protein